MMVLLGILLATGAGTPPIPPAPAGAAQIRPAPTKPTRAQVLAAVRSEWLRYDLGGKGRLTPLEFSTWVMRSHGGTVAARTREAGIAPVSAMNASATAFSRADANHDGGVTPDEMASFLMLPPAPIAPGKPKPKPPDAAPERPPTAGSSTTASR
jgi:hypothetical protein